MKSWIISVCALAIITTIILIILPQGKLGQYIKNIFSLLLVIVIIQPIVKINFDTLSYDFFNYDIEVELQDNYLTYVTNSRVENLELKCENIILNLGVKGASVDIQANIKDFDFKKIDKVLINLEKAEIINDNSHIDIIEQIISNVSEYLSVEKKLVVVYE